MSSCYLDANLLIYFQNQKSQFHQQTVQIIKNLVSKDYELVISSLVLDEYLYKSLQLSEDSKSETLKRLEKGLKKILTLPKIKLVNPPLQANKHLKVIGIINKHNLKPRDAYHLFIMLENKVKCFASFDKDFDKIIQKGLIKKFE